MESYFVLILIIIAIFIGLFLWAFVPVFGITIFYILHATAPLIESKKSFYLRWITAKLLHLLTYLTARLLLLYGWLMHSYEIKDIENIPTDRPVLLIFYHGVMPADIFYLIVKMYLERGCVLRAVIDKANVGATHCGGLLHNYAFPGPKAHCVATLQHGHSLVISPGGMRECLFATRRYETLWDNRIGFAKVAREAKVDIIPIFTRNIRQMFIQPEWLQNCTRQTYEKNKIPIFLPLGVFPVKLVTQVGKAIPYNSVDSAEELAQLTQRKIDSMISEHQTFPATIPKAILERFINTDSQF